MNIDILSQVCVFNEYPLWRSMLTKYRTLFKKIILYPSRHHGFIDEEVFMREVFPETWINNHYIDWAKAPDWRQEETMPLIEQSDAEWVLFLEQDFFVDNWDKLWKDIEKAMEYSDAIGWWNQTAFPYLHPCFLLIKREVLNRTKMDFSAHPEIPGCDHFAMITRDLEAMGAMITKLQDLGWINWLNAFHLGGITYPYQNWKGDGTDVFGVGNIPAFYAYNEASRKVDIEKDLQYLNLSLKIKEELEKQFPNIKETSKEWNHFFKI